MENFCLSCIVTNPIGKAFFDYSAHTYVAWGPTTVWFLGVGVILTVIYYAIMFARYSIVETPDSDPFALVVDAGVQAFWIVSMGALMVGATSADEMSLTFLWQAMSDLALGGGIELMQHLNPDIEPPKYAANSASKLTGMFEQGILDFIWGGIELANDSDWWSIFKIGNTALRIVMGLVLSLGAIVLLCMFVYEIITQTIMGGFVIGFGPWILLCGAFKPTRSVFWAGIHILIYAMAMLAVVSFVGGFILWIFKTISQVSMCIAKAPDDMAAECEQQIAAFSALLLNGSDQPSSNILRHLNNVQFYMTTLFLMIVSGLMIWTSEGFVSSLLKMNGARGGAAALGGAVMSAIGAVTGGLAAMIMANNNNKSDGEGDNSGDSGGGKDAAESDSKPDEEGDVPSEGETRN